MEKEEIYSILEKYISFETWIAKETYFVSAIVHGKYKPCVLMANPLPQSLGEIFIHKTNTFIFLDIEQIFESKFSLPMKFAPIIINETKNQNRYFAFEMDDGSFFNYFLKLNSFFIIYPEGYGKENIIKIYPNKIYRKNALVDIKEKYVNELTFLEAHDYVTCYL